MGIPSVFINSQFPGWLTAENSNNRLHIYIIEEKNSGESINNYNNGWWFLKETTYINNM